MKNKKILLGFIKILGVIIIFCIIIFIMLMPIYMILGDSNKTEMKQQLKKNKDLLTCVATAFSEIEEDFIVVNAGYISLKIDDIEKYELSKKEKSYVDILLSNKNYKYISKYKNTVFFCVYTRFTTAGGLAFTEDGRIPKTKTGRIIYSRISDNWYWCEIQ